MPEGLKPCPVCGHAHPQYEYGIHVICPSCGLSFPTDEEHAADVWNALPRNLHWTKEKPTDANWYWVRFPKGEPNMGIAFIKNGFLEFAGEEQKFSISDDLEFAGPIPKPEQTTCCTN